MRILKAAVRSALRVVFKVLFRVKVRGDLSPALAQVQARQPLLVVANHESFLDGLLLGLFLPLDPVFVVNTEIARHPGFRLALSLVDHLPVDPANPLAIRNVIKLLEAGRPVVIFPEGRITVTGSLMKVYDGPAFAAARTQAALLPVRIDGATRTLFSRVSGRHRRSIAPQLTVDIQPLTRIPDLHGQTSKARRKEAGEHLRLIMQHMLFATRQQHQSLPEALLDAVRIYGRGHACLEDMRPGKYTYGDLLDMSMGLSRIVRGVAREGDAVGVLMPNMATTVGLLFGLQMAGRVPALLNYTAGAEGMRAACVAAGVRTLVTSRAFVDKAGLGEVLRAMEAGDEAIAVAYLEDLRGRLGMLDKAWLGGLARWFPRAAIPPIPPERPAVILFTSGTEGKPKGVVLSHRALLANLAQIRAVIDVTPNDKIMNVLPLFHSFGLTGGTLLPLLSGAEAVMYPSPLHYKVIPELVYDRNCTVLFGTSTFLGGYAKHAHPVDFYKLRYVIAGAEKLNDAVRETWASKFGIRVLEGYGATETAPVLAVNTLQACRPGSVGQLLPGIEARVVPVPGIDRGGMLHVKGPNLMSGYLRYERPCELEHPASEAGPGWYNTGDVVEIDADGFVHILGRVKRFAKIAGEMVSLEVVEKLAAQAASTALHAATTVADEKRGEAVVLFTTDGTLTREQLQQAARDLGLPELAVPRRVRHLAGLPVLGTGKLDYVALKRMAEESGNE